MQVCVNSREINGHLDTITSWILPEARKMSFRSTKEGANVLPFPGRRTLAVAQATETSAEPLAELLPVLVVLHQETSTPGRVGNALRALGHRLDIRRPRFGDALPETLDQHAGAVMFGGPMSANDPDAYIRHEIDWIDVPLREQRPFLGICLGAQMLAMHLGAKVAPHPQGVTQIGYYPIRPTPAARRSVRTGRIKSTTGTARDSSSLRAPSCWRKATTFRCRHSGPAMPSACSFIPT